MYDISLKSMDYKLNAVCLNQGVSLILGHGVYRFWRNDHVRCRDTVPLTQRTIVPPLTNRFLSMTGIWTLGFGRGRNGRLFLAIAGLFVFF